AGAGSIVALIGQISGSDELYYDPTTAAFYVTGVAASGDRVFDVINDATDAVLQSVSLTALGADHVNAHSIAVDPLNGRVFVPLQGTLPNLPDVLCPVGCVAVFASAGSTVPEPGTLPSMVLGVVIVAIASGRRVRARAIC